MKIVRRLSEVSSADDDQFGWLMYDWQTVDHPDIFKSDRYIRTYFEKLFGINIRRAYVSECVNEMFPKGDELNWGTRRIILFLGNGNIVEMYNSEWATFQLYKDKK
jgi:hypothetical protein